MPKVKQIKIADIDFDKAFDVHKMICEIELQRRELLAKNIRLLTEMFDKQYYKAILGEPPTPRWAGYLGMIEIYYSRGEVERWRKIYHVFVEDFQMKFETFIEIPVSRLEQIAQFAKNKEDAEKLISLAAHNNPQEWRDTLLIHEGKPDHYDCEHTNKIFQECTKCGNKHLVEMDMKEYEHQTRSDGPISKGV